MGGFAEILAVVMAGLIILIPVSGLTARFLFKPRRSPVDIAQIQQQLTLLAEQQEELAAELHRLKEAQEFQARLLERPQGNETL
ncbi:MAG: hypothetical protein JSU87_12375 [Gemmatimonadota bacterium]|jgi:Tfp pilus assembly protein PilN|nr:MAG: hypothetical protein JSU87_12375 [Gemmatimonadota bacterium]